MSPTGSCLTGAPPAVQLLKSSRIDRGSHITQVAPGRSAPRIDERIRSEAMAFLDSRGLDIGLFEWPLTKEAATAAA